MEFILGVALARIFAQNLRNLSTGNSSREKISFIL